MSVERTEQRRVEDIGQDKAGTRVHYEPPLITTYSSEDIKEQTGPAQACSPDPCGIF